jgi:hypothetical protein
VYSKANISGRLLRRRPTANQHHSFTSHWQHGVPSECTLAIGASSTSQRWSPGTNYTTVHSVPRTSAPLTALHTTFPTTQLLRKFLSLFQRSCSALHILRLISASHLVISSFSRKL